MNLVMVVLRVVHVFSGVLWVGATFVVAFFVLPTSKALGAEGGRFVQRLAGPAGLSNMMNLAALLLLFSGLAMFAMITGQGAPGMMRSPSMMVLSVGALFGLLAVGHGFTAQRATAAKLAALGQAVATSGGAPTAEQMQSLDALRDKLQRGNVASAWMQGIAVVCMAAERYLA